jgi:hypothetical protein
LISAAIVVIALLQWLFFWARFVLRRDGSKGRASFLLSTMAMALVWTSLAAVWAGVQHVDRRGALRRAGCAAIRQGMSAAELEKVMQSPARKVTEADTRGPGAESWVYDSAGCVAHVLNNRVRAVDNE